MTKLILCLFLCSCAPRVITSEASCVKKIDPLLQQTTEQSFNCTCTCPASLDVANTAGVVGGLLSLFGK